MRHTRLVVIAGLVCVALVWADTLGLPAADTVGSVSLERVLFRRRSARSFSDSGLGIAEVAQLLWAGQGRTAIWGGRTSPSAGGTYPLELYLVAGKVVGLQPGVYRYLPDEHSLQVVKLGDLRGSLASVALRQTSVAAAPAVLVLASDYRRTTVRYGNRGARYVHMEAGHVGQNVHLQCEALGLGTVMIGAFDDEGVQKAIGIPYEPLYIMPVGRKKGE